MRGSPELDALLAIPWHRSSTDGIANESEESTADEEEEDEDDSEADGEEFEESHVEGAIPMQPRQDVTDSLDVSFGGMSISPAHPPQTRVMIA